MLVFVFGNIYSCFAAKHFLSDSPNPHARVKQSSCVLLMIARHYAHWFWAGTYAQEASDQRLCHNTLSLCCTSLSPYNSADIPARLFCELQPKCICAHAAEIVACSMHGHSLAKNESYLKMTQNCHEYVTYSGMQCIARKRNQCKADSLMQATANLPLLKHYGDGRSHISYHEHRL